METLHHWRAPNRHRWAVCCSGGGIRSAAYSLGAAQSLADHGFPLRDSVFVGVSGGSYLAAARALTAHQHGDREPYRPGSPEERNLRNNTQYLGPDARTWIAGVLSMVSGAVAISAIMLAPVLLAAYIWGAVLRHTGVLTTEFQVDVTVPGWRLPATVTAVTAILAFLGWRVDRRHRTGWTIALGWAVAAAVTVAFATLAVPYLVSWLAGLNADAVPVDLTWLPASALAVVSSLVALVHAAVDVVRRQRIDTDDQPGWLSSVIRAIGGWSRRVLLPWLAVALIVVVTLVALLAWTAHSATGPWDRTTVAWLVGAAAVLLGARFLVDLNRLSMHDFYRWRLADGYGPAPDTRPGHEAGWRSTARLSELTGTALVIAAAANINANRERPPGHGSCLLTFEPERVRLWTPGTRPTRATAPTRDMELLVGRKRFTLFNVVAISGAALAPLMGSATNPAFRLPMTVANIRLGVWLPHPMIVTQARRRLSGMTRREHALIRVLPLWLRYLLPHPRSRSEATNRRVAVLESTLWAHLLYLRERAQDDSVPWWRRRAAAIRAGIAYQAMQPTLGLLWAESVGRLSYRGTWIHASDGGHYDNLGLIAALRQGADRIIVLDASGDDADSWATIGDVQALARVDAGVEITLDPSVMRPADQKPDERPLAPGEVVRPWVTGTFTRPGTADPGRLWLCKLGWWQGASWDVRAYAAEHPRFPNTSTGRQLYGADEFEAYRALGYQAMTAAYGAGPLVPATTAVGR